MPQISHTVEVEVQRAALEAARASAAEVVALADLSLALQKASGAEVTSPNPGNPSASERNVTINFAKKSDADSFVAALMRVATGRAPEPAGAK